MLKITIPAKELYDEKNNEFVYVKEQTLCLEHSLVSISKWEEKYHKPFLDSEKTVQEVLDYIRYMTITQNVNPLIYSCLTPENVQLIKAYIDDPMTATTFSDNSMKHGPKQIITNELIYSWMIELGIPVEFQKWHLNRLLTLIRVRTIRESGPGKKMSKAEIMSRNKALNAARRKKYNTKG